MPKLSDADQAGNPDAKRRQSSSSALKRMSHPNNTVAFTKRLESVMKRGVALTPLETQKFKSPMLCDFDRLAVPKDVRLTKVELAVEKELRCFLEQAHIQKQQTDDKKVNDQNTSHHSSSTRPSSASIVNGDATRTPLELCRLKQTCERLRCVSALWPPPKAAAFMEKRDRRLDPVNVSAPLRRAIYGQSLDRVLQRNQERSKERSPHLGSDDGHDTTHEELTLHVTIDGMDSFSPSKRNKNNNIFLVAAQEIEAGKGAGGVHGGDDPLSDWNPSDVAELTKLADANYRKTLSNVGHREYTLIRKLFSELDDKGEGVVELAQVLRFHHKYPKRLGRDILDNLRVELDGRIFLDELIRVHFPGVPQDSIEQLIELYEPKVQSMDAVLPETIQKLQTLYTQIMEKFSHATFSWWLASRKSSSSSPPALGGEGGGGGASMVTADERALECSGRSGELRRSGNYSDNNSSGPDHATGGGVDDERSSPRSRASSITRSDAGTIIPLNSGGRASSTHRESVCTSVTSAGSVPTMNAMQLLLHMQQSASGHFSVKELTQLYRLKHLNLRPSFSLQLTRAIRRANLKHPSSNTNKVHSFNTTITTNGGGGGSGGAVVVDPSSGVSIPLALLHSAVSGPSGEPSFPFLTNCIVRFPDFVVLLMDYFVMKQNGDEVEPYDPSLKAYLDRLTWDKMFPHTGPVRNYFKKL